MKKSLIALAVAGAFAAPAAMAEVTISGAVNIGIAHIDSDGDATTPGASRQSLATNYSNMNISSTDDIGNGNSIILNIQFDLGALNNTNAFGNRNSYLGIQGGWGSFKMGTNENVYERWAYESDPLDGAMGIGGNIQMLGQIGLGGPAWFDVGNGQNAGDVGSFWRRTHHTVWYTSPVIARGITFEIDYTLSAFKDNIPGTDPQVLSAGVQWKPEGSPFFLNLGYETHTDNTGLVATALLGATRTDDTGISFGGGVTLGNFLITARYEMLEWEGDVGGTLERTHMWAGVKWSMPTGYVGAEFGMADDLDGSAAAAVTGGAASGASMIGLGYFHNLSKQSQMYVVGTMIDNDDAAFYGIGAGTGSPSVGDQMGLTVGLKHVF
jgi:predicted porin